MLASLVRLYRRLRFGAPIVVVSGLPRSGTSMLMKMIEAGGLPLVTDGLRTADEDNPKGYYELERVKNLAEETDKGYLKGARGKGVKVISYLLRSPCQRSPAVGGDFSKEIGPRPQFTTRPKLGSR